MDAKKVLRYLYELRTIKHDEKHIYDCLLEQLIAEAEHEAQTGGWKPGTEPPDAHRLVALERSDFPGQVGTGLYLESGTRGWMSQSGSPIFRVDRWHELPPLPEQAP